jgi:amino acid adenylation domain-containing protein
MARSPLGHVGFVLQKPQQSSDLATLAYISGEAASRIDFGGLELEYYHLPQQEGQGDLELDMLEASDSFLGNLKFNTDIFDGSTIARLADHFQTLLGSIIANPEHPISELPILTDAERQQVIVEWNSTQADYPRDLSIHELFEAQVECTPDKIALRFEDKADHLTYKELNERSDQLAHYLRSVGTGPGSVVGLYMHRSLDMVVALLGVLKAGGAYLPLDPAFPVDRLKYMLSDSQAEVMLTNVDPKWVQNLETDTTEGHLLIVNLDTDWPEISSFTSAREENIQSPSLSDHLAYLIYTSGSTGVPKGVEISHRAVVNFLLSMQSEPGLSPEDTLLAVTTMSFDIAVLEIFLPLITGAQVVLASREVAYDGHRLIKMLNDTGATIMQATPATWRLLIESGWQGNPQLKSLCGGEALPKDLALLLLDRVGELWNMYGPTETTVWSTTVQIQPDCETITIGRPIANTQIYILDDRHNPVPIGVMGNLFIGGDGLAHGYHNREELTKEKFLPNPFDDRNSSRLYRTGDLARYHEDGNIEFYGRTDHQVKIRGFRIELGEIEVVLSQHPAVRENIVITKEDATAEKCLIAYLVIHQETTLTINELRNFMQDKLPNYMIPAFFVFLDSLPLTPNGKTDRKALPEPKALHPESQATYQAPQTDVEQTIATIWQDVLKLEKVGIHDNFLDMGGHSLLMAQVHSKLGETLSLDDLPLVKLFQYATISTLAKYISNQVDELPSPEAINDRAKRQKAALARQKQLMRKVKRIGE